MMRNQRIFFPLIISSAILILILIYLFPDFWNGNSEYEWRVLWHGRKIRLIWVFGLWTAIICGLFFLGRGLERFSEKKARWIFPSLLFGAGIISFLVFSQINRYGGYELLVKVFVADHNSYYVDALKYPEKSELIEAYQSRLLSLHTHSRTHPPLSVWIFSQINHWAKKSEILKGIYQGIVSEKVIKELERHFQVSLSQQAGGFWAGVLMLFCGGLALVLSYFILRRFYPPFFCYLSGLVVVSVPGYSLRAPVMDQVFAIFILVSALLVLSRTKWFYLKRIFAGIFLGIGVWMSPGVWSGLLLIFLLLFAENRAEKKPLKELFSQKEILGFFLLLLFLTGTIILISLWMDIGYFEVFRLNRIGFHFNNQVGGRLKTWKWMLFNPYEYLFWLSVPLIWGFLLKIGKEIKSFKEKGEIGDYFFWAVLVFFLLLNFSGQLCYESPRLLWFFNYLAGASLVSGFLPIMKNFHSQKWLVILGTASAQTCLFHLIY